jgi:hypothetical protein
MLSALASVSVNPSKPPLRAERRLIRRGLARNSIGLGVSRGASGFHHRVQQVRGADATIHSNEGQ